MCSQNTRRQAGYAMALWAGLLATTPAAAGSSEPQGLAQLAVSAVVLSRCVVALAGTRSPPRVDCARGPNAYQVAHDAPLLDGTTDAQAIVAGTRIVEVTF